MLKAVETAKFQRSQTGVLIGFLNANLKHYGPTRRPLAFSRAITITVTVSTAPKFEAHAQPQIR